MMTRFAIALLAGCTIATQALAQLSPSQHGDGTRAAQPYAGQQSRTVTTLSAEDVDALLAGRGWGLALPAELNGYPGPVHVLELAEKLELNEKQKKRVEQIFKRMQLRARSIGARYVEAERAIDNVFKSGAAYSGGALQTQLRDAERLRAELRRAHLQAHIETTPVLTETQRKMYVELRGYAGGTHGGHQGEHQQHKH